MNFELNYDLKNKEVKDYNGHSVYFVKKEVDNYYYLKLRMHRNFDVDLGVIPKSLWDDDVTLKYIIKDRLNKVVQRIKSNIIIKDNID